MYSLHPALHTPDQAELSRRAAERYADLSAARQQRAQRRGAARHRRQVLAARLAVDVSTDSPRS